MDDRNYSDNPDDIDDRDDRDNRDHESDSIINHPNKSDIFCEKFKPNCCFKPKFMSIGVNIALFCISLPLLVMFAIGVVLDYNERQLYSKDNCLILSNSKDYCNFTTIDKMHYGNMTCDSKHYISNRTYNCYYANSTGELVLEMDFNGGNFLIIFSGICLILCVIFYFLIFGEYKKP